MSMLSYNDHCVITRMNGVDEYDEPIVEEIYNDRCDFQPGGQTALSIITHNDVVYLPRQVMVVENDLITVISQTGRKREGVVKIANDLGFDLMEEWVTEIEIKQSTEK